MKNYLRFFRSGFPIAALLVSLGWTIMTREHRMYDGAPLSADKIAKVSADANITVYSADWKEFNTFTLVGDRTTELQFLPGPHTIVARYCAIWNVGPGDSDNATIASAYLTLRFQAEAGHIYRIAYPDLPTLDHARTFAQKPDLWIEDLQTHARLAQLPESAFAKTQSAAAPAAVAASVTATTPTPAVASMPMETAPATAVTTAPAVSALSPAPATPVGAEEVSTLQLLKFSWQKAAPAERDAFREWIGKNPAP